MGNILLFRQSLLIALLCLLSFFCYAQVTEQWVRRYNGPGNDEDYTHDLVIDANGTELWVKRYSCFIDHSTENLYTERKADGSEIESVFQ
jgi:hypothetical protein